MVKFGRHVDFFVANELDAARRLYVVPYKEVRERCVEIPARTAPPPPLPVTVLSPTPIASNFKSYGAAEEEKKEQSSPATVSGLTALFSNADLATDSSPGGVVGPETTFATTNEADADAVDNIAESAPLRAARARPATTLNAGTGAELARAVKHLVTAQRKTSAAVIPNDYGYDDPCNVDDRSEEDEEAQVQFLALRFRTEWRMCLKRASADFDRAMQLFWSEVFEGITSYNPHGVGDEPAMGEHKEEMNDYDYEDAIRGALPDAALRMYVAAVPPERAQETFSFLKDIHSTALINAEALRKLVKKFDKLYHKGVERSQLLSAMLLPEVYASNFTGSLASLEAGLALLRVLLNIEEGDDREAGGPDAKEEETPRAVKAEKRRLRKLATMDDDTRDVAVLRVGYFSNKMGDSDAELVKRRKEELQWLRGMVEGIDPVYIPFLVAHRGFHSIHDRSDVRPLENSLMSYEAAWTNGLHLCECDIALTKDERIILAHDENFARLGMDPASPLCNRTVRDLTFKELMNCPLKSGARPPLLFDVLRSAAAIGDDAKMIVEIKAGNTEASSALARMFLRHPQLMEHVAAVMSFDAFIMHNLRREMAAVFEQLHGARQQQHAIVAPDARHAHAASADAVVHPLKAPVLSNIALGSTLSSSPLPTPCFGVSSHNRVPSVLGGHNRLDSRDMFGLGYQLPDQQKASDVGLGMNLAEVDNSMTQSSTFLPIHKSQNELLPPIDHEEKVELADDEISPSASPSVPPDAGPIQSFPKLLLITVSETPKQEYELFVDVTSPAEVAKLDGWLRGGDGGTLDGVYMQYQKSMMGPEGSKAMRNLASRYDVGIWGANPVPDDWGTFHALVTECHVSYVNTSLPKHFRRKMKRSMSANTLAMNGILASHSYDHLT